MSRSVPLAPRRRLSTAHGARVLLIAGFVLALATPSGFAQLTPQGLLADSTDQVDDPKYAGVTEAFRLFQAGKAEEARDRLKDVCAKAPELPPAEVLFAKMLLAAGDRVAASQALDRAILDAPKDPEAYIMYGDMLFQQSQFAPAHLMFLRGEEERSAYDANAKRNQALLCRAVAGMAAVAEARELWDVAEMFLRAWKDAAPDSAAAAQRLATVLYRLGKYDDALAEFGNLARLDPNAGSAEANLGTLYARDGKDVEAKAMMEKASSQGADDLSTRLTVAHWAIDAGLLDMAQENAVAASKLAPDSLAARLLLGLIARHKQDYDVAEKTFSAAHLAAPSSFAASNNLALTLAEQDNEAKLRQALALATVNARTYDDVRTVYGREAAVTYGWILYRSGEKALAVQTIQNVPVPIPTKESAFLAAKVFADAGRPDVVVRLLRPALDDQKQFLGRKEAEQLLAKATEDILNQQSGAIPPRE